jgi:FixJ family two-component response regulator
MKLTKEALLQRLASALATNPGSQLTRKAIWLRLETLTAREVDVLCSILTGQLNKEIAEDLAITLKTAKAHRASLMRKLGVQSSAQLFPMVLQVLTPKKRKSISGSWMGRQAGQVIGRWNQRN